MAWKRELYCTKKNAVEQNGLVFAVGEVLARLDSIVPGSLEDRAISGHQRDNPRRLYQGLKSMPRRSHGCGKCRQRKLLVSERNEL